jgi:hypothetical protein
MKCLRFCFIEGSPSTFLNFSMAGMPEIIEQIVGEENSVWLKKAQV